MAEYDFSNAERYGVYAAFGGECFWCHIPLTYYDCTVDHVIPEKFLKTPTELKTLLAEYNLGENFNLNDFANWVPAHQKCNSSKGGRTFKTSAALIKQLDDVAKRAEDARKKALIITNSQKSSKLLAQMCELISQGTLSKEDSDLLYTTLDQFCATVPVEPNSPPTRLNFSSDMSLLTSSTKTIVVRVGTFFRVPNGDVSMTVKPVDAKLYEIRFKFLQGNGFDLNAIWRITGTDVRFEPLNKELTFLAPISECSSGHIFHLFGPSVINHYSDSEEPAYRVEIAIVDGVFIVTELAGLEIFESKALTFSGTYLRSHGVKLEYVRDRFNRPAFSNGHPNSDSSWECPICGGTTWSGTQCSSCGQLIDPAD